MPPTMPLLIPLFVCRSASVFNLFNLCIGCFMQPVHGDIRNEK